MHDDSPTPDLEELLLRSRETLDDDGTARLRRRVEQRLDRAPRAARRRVLAVSLLAGLVVTGSSTAVLAANSAGGGSNVTTSTFKPKDAAGCQYKPSWSKSISYKKDGVTTTLTTKYDCKTQKFTITVTCSKPISYYWCNGKRYTVAGGSKTTTFVLSAGDHSVSLPAGNGVLTVPVALKP